MKQVKKGKNSKTKCGRQLDSCTNRFKVTSAAKRQNELILKENYLTACYGLTPRRPRFKSHLCIFSMELACSPCPTNACEVNC